MKKVFIDSQQHIAVKALTPDANLSARQIENFLKEFGKQKLHNEIIKTVNGKPAKIYLTQSIHTDSKRGMKTPEAFGNCPEGCWFAIFWVQDKDVYQHLKNSDGKELDTQIETFFATRLKPKTQMKTQTHLAAALRILAASQKSKSGKITDGSVLLWNGELKQGTEILVEVDQGKADPLPVPPGVYTFENGMQIEVDTLSKVVRISEKPTKQNTKFGMLPVWKYCKFKQNPALLNKDMDAWRDRYMK